MAFFKHLLTNTFTSEAAAILHNIAKMAPKQFNASFKNEDSKTSKKFISDLGRALSNSNLGDFIHNAVNPNAVNSLVIDLLPYYDLNISDDKAKLIETVKMALSGPSSQFLFADNNGSLRAQYSNLKRQAGGVMTPDLIRVAAANPATYLVTYAPELNHASRFDSLMDSIYGQDKGASTKRDEAATGQKNYRLHTRTNTLTEFLRNDNLLAMHKEGVHGLAQVIVDAVEDPSAKESVLFNYALVKSDTIAVLATVNPALLQESFKGFRKCCGTADSYAHYTGQIFSEPHSLTTITVVGNLIGADAPKQNRYICGDKMRSLNDRVQMDILSNNDGAKEIVAAFEGNKMDAIMAMASTTPKALQKVVANNNAIVAELRSTNSAFDKFHILEKSLGAAGAEMETERAEQVGRSAVA